MRSVRGCLRRAGFSSFLALALLVVAGGVRYMITFAQSQTPQTYVVKVNPDGTFTPQVVYIKSGDTVRWEQLGRTDSIVTVDGSQGYPAMCSSRKPYNPAAPNEFTGPNPFAPSGVFTLSQLDRGFIEATGRCPANVPPLATGDNGLLLCPGGNYEETLDSTWRSPNARRIRFQRSSTRDREGCEERQAIQPWN
jgi:plastocyanin